MKVLQVLGFSLVALTAGRLGAEDFLDQVDEALTVTGFNNNIRARLSGLMDLEGYYFQQPAPGLIYASDNALFNPRLTFFLDVQLGSHVYAFAQSRVDRGFDPSDGGAEARLDEYALRVTPWDDGRFNVQAGKFATVVGNWVERHQTWENPLITAPLPYENVTAIYDSRAPSSAKRFTRGLVFAKYAYNPVIWGPSYATGVSTSGRLGQFDYAAEVKNAALSSRPETWDATEVGFDYPTASGRLGFRPNQMWNLGVSVSNGPYFRAEAKPTLPPGHGIGDYHELVLGQDIGFAWHHLQIWAEFYEVRFDVPRVGNADTFAYYLEAKYKFTPQFFGALRWNQQLFATVPDGAGGYAQWGQDIWRSDVAVGYRFTAHTQIKLQYSLQHQDSVSSDFGHLVAAQFTLRF
ncbi:MAG: hypothetical protein NT105_11355 [Verrucomicrobia bacterium]|nr:hypothetical protein [Verrucomicrobiota bacterium]